MNQDEFNARRMMHKIIANAMEKQLERADYNVVQPLPLVDKKATERLSADDYISWQLILKEWSKVSDQGKKVIAKLLVLNSHTLVESLNSPQSIMEEAKDTLDYLKDHPEFKRETNKEDSEVSFEDFLHDLLGDNEEF